MKILIMVCGAAVTALATTLVACRVTVETGQNVPILGDSTVEAEFDPWSGSGSVPPQSGLAEGDCVKITFYGSDGQPIGSTTTQVGEDFDVPEGTDKASISPCDPPEEPDEKDKKKRRAGSSSSIVAQDLERFGYACIPFNLTGGPYHYADFWVTASSRAEADRIADDFVLGMLSEPAPARVEPEGVVEVEVGPDASVRVSMFSTSQPQSLAFEWNGAALYGLDDAAVVPLDGWFVTTVVVPPSLVDVDLVGSSENSLRYRLGLASGDEVGTTVSVSVTP